MPSIVMSFTTAVMKSEFNAVGFKNQSKTLRTLPQTQKGKTNKAVDASIKAKLPGKRISKTGKIYWETRQNRSDAKGKKI